MKRRVKTGDQVRVTFYDHSEGGNAEPVQCTVWGKIVKLDRRYMIVESWHCHESEESDNRHRFALVRSAITEQTVLRERKT